MIYMNCEEPELLKVISKKDLEWAASVRIPYNSSGGEWAKKHSIDSKIKTAINKGKITPIKYEEIKPTRSVQIIGDYIAGPNGSVKNMADGKVYDSKSAYYKAVKAAGCVVMGNDAPKQAKEAEYKINERELKQDIAKAIQQLGG